MEQVENAHERDSNRPEWPESSPISGAAHERVGGTVSCVMTRFRLSSFWFLPLFYLAFRRVRKDALATVPGLIEAVLLTEGIRTCYTLSLWTDDNAIVDFGSVNSHVRWANWGLLRAYRKDLHRPEIWSVHWRLWAISHNLNWEGVDLRAVLAKQLGKPAEQVGRGIRHSSNV